MTANGLPVQSGSALTNAWTLVTATFKISTISYKSSIRVYFDSALAYSNDVYSSGTPPFPFADTDIIQLGGPISFLGKLANVRLYTPGSSLLTAGIIRTIFMNLFLVDVCSSFTSCLYHIGMINNLPNSCLSCPTPSDIFFSQCLTCPEDKFIVGYHCEGTERIISET